MTPSRAMVRVRERGGPMHAAGGHRGGERHVNSDTILVPNGTYTLTLGSLDVHTSMRIAGSGAGTVVQAATSPGTATIDVVRMEPDGPAITVSMVDLTLRHGVRGIRLSGDSADGTSLDLTRVLLTNNSVRGIGTFDAKLTIQDSVISNNAAGLSCGGDWQPGNLAEVTVTRTSIVSNVSNDPEVDGAGIAAGDCILTVRDSTIANNFALGGNGGGLWIIERGAKQFVNVTFSGNVANQGGGIFVVDNQDGGSLSLQNVTLAGNAARQPNGGHVLFMDSGANVSIQNTILSHAQPSGPVCAFDTTFPAAIARR